MLSVNGFRPPEEGRGRGHREIKSSWPRGNASSGTQPSCSSYMLYREDYSAKVALALLRIRFSADNREAICAELSARAAGRGGSGTRAYVRQVERLCLSTYDPPPRATASEGAGSSLQSGRDTDMESAPEGGESSQEQAMGQTRVVAEEGGVHVRVNSGKAPLGATPLPISRSATH